MVEPSTISPPYIRKQEEFQTMNVIKRSGEEVQFDIDKIVNAIRKANAATPQEQMSDQEILAISRAVEETCVSLKRASSVEEIQDLVEREIMSHGYFSVAKNYITYRYERALVRKANSTDQQIMSLLERNN